LRSSEEQDGAGVTDVREFRGGLEEREREGHPFERGMTPHPVA
jgi:hypothetical protein